MVTLAVIPLVMAWCGARLIQGDATMATKLLLSPVLPSIAVFALWVLFGTSYQIRADALLVRVAPLRWHIRLETIVEISPDRNLLSSAALSHTRLRIRRSGDSDDIYVSPRDPDSFLDSVQQHSRRLRRDGGRLVRNEDLQPPIGAGTCRWYHCRFGGMLRQVGAASYVPGDRAPNPGTAPRSI